jgi:hypothetical protein
VLNHPSPARRRLRLVMQSPGDAAPTVQGVLFRLPVVEDVGAPKRHIEILETDRSGAEEASYGSVQIDWLVGPGRRFVSDASAKVHALE